MLHLTCLFSINEQLHTLYTPKQGCVFVWFRLVRSQGAIRSIIPGHYGCNPSPTISKVVIITSQKWPKMNNQPHFTRSIFFTCSKRSDETTIKLGSFGHSKNVAARLCNVWANEKPSVLLKALILQLHLQSLDPINFTRMVLQVPLGNPWPNNLRLRTAGIF